MNKNGFLELGELKILIKNGHCPDLSRRQVKAILGKHDTNGDGKLSFEEFYELSTTDPWFVRYYGVKFSKFLIPPGAVLKKVNFDLRENFKNLLIKIFLDGIYENEVGCFPPPLTMVTFSIVQIAIYFWSL